jgi:hypothetical protein
LVVKVHLVPCVQLGPPRIRTATKSSCSGARPSTRSSEGEAGRIGCVNKVSAFERVQGTVFY